jgi:enoyl-CoA hydratase/carnithine racemase
VAIHYDKTSSEIPEHVVVITIDRPETKNALDLYHFRDLAPAARVSGCDGVLVDRRTVSR